jgi:hypothetical protein
LWTAADRRPFVLASVRAAVVTLLLTAYYWLPASLEKRYTLLAARLGDSWADHFVAPMQLVRATWGFSFDVPGLPNRMSFQLGLAQWVVLAGGLALAGMLLGRRERSGRVPVLVVLLGTAAASLYGTLPASAWFYRLLQHAVVIDLPWKCLAVTVFCAAASFAVGLAHLRPRGAVRYGVVAVVLGLALWGNREHVAVPAWEDIPDAHWWRSAATSNDYDEYTPATFEPSACSPEDPELVTLAGDAESRMLARRSNALSFASTVRSDGALVQVKVAWYPGWQLFVDGRRSVLAHRHGRVVASVPRGEHVVSLAWRETGWRLAGDCASLIGLLYVVATGLHAARRPRA